MRFSVYPGITTTSDDWREKIVEADRLKIPEVAFFPTCLEYPQRLEAYTLLANSKIRRIPFVHLRNDMDAVEVRTLITKFGTEKFNIHSPLDKKLGLKHDLSEFKDLIYVENSTFPWGDSISDWAGICLDVTHLEAENLMHSRVLADWNFNLEKYPVGAWHVSAIFDPPKLSRISDQLMHDQHEYDCLSRFDYVKKYVKYLPDTVAIELENKLEEQMKVKEYLERILRRVV